MKPILEISSGFRAPPEAQAKPGAANRSDSNYPAPRGLRILHTIRSADPEGGGPIEGITQVSRTLAAMGHAAALVSLDAPGAPFLERCPLPVQAAGPGRNGYGFSRSYTAWIRAQAANFDAVIVNGLWQFNSFGTWLALRNSRVPYFVFPHGMLDPWFKRTYPLKHMKKWLYWPWAEYRVLRDARAVLFTCEEERRLARGSFWLYRCRERVVNYGTAAPDGDPNAQRESFLARFPKLRHKRLLLFMGRIHVKKGCDVLLRAFRTFLANHSAAADPEPWHLVFAGPDQTGWQRELEDEALRMGIADRVTFTGMIRGDEKWGAFHASELFLLPSHQENFGIAVVEALACGVPVVISTAVNIWREITEAGAGWACEPSADQVSRCLGRWAALGGAEKLQATHRARACFEQRFEIQQVARSLVDVLREQTHSRPAARV